MKKRFLESTPLFAVLSDEERRALAERFELRQFQGGTLLYKQGEPPTEMYMVKSGVVRLLEQDASGERMVATLGPSSVLGEIDLLLRRPHQMTAISQGDSDVWMITTAALAEVISQYPAMGIKLSSFLGERIADVDQYLISRLEQVSVLTDLDRESLEMLAGSLTLQDVRQGSLIFQSGVEAETLYLIENGTVTIVSTETDAPEPFQQLAPGEMFGHEALLRDREYGAVARAATDVQLWALSRADFEQVATTHPSVRQALTTYVREYTLAPADRGAAAIALRAAPLFNSLPNEVMDTIVSRLTLRHAGTNETVFTAGEPGDAFYLVDRGMVKLLDGAEVVALKEEGDYFGERALLTGEAREYTARATRSTNLWLLSKRDFDAIAVRHPELTTVMSRTFADSLAEREDGEAQPDFSLSMFPLFTGLTPQQQADVARRLRPMDVHAEEVVFRRGAVTEGLYLVKRGQVKLLGEQGIFDIVRAGGFFGEMALLTGNNHTVTAQAIEDTELLLLDRTHFEAVVSRYPSVSLVLSRALSARLEAANMRGTVPSYHTAPMPAIDPAATASPSTAAGGTGQQRPQPAGPRVPVKPNLPPPPSQVNERGRWTSVKFWAVMALVLWLVGVSAPAMMLNSAAHDENSSFGFLRGLTEIGLSPTPTITPTATPTVEPSSTPTVRPTSTPDPTLTPVIQEPTPEADPQTTSDERVDSDLASLGLSVEPVGEPEETTYWQLLEIVPYEGELEDGDDHVLLVEVLDEGGEPADGATVVISSGDDTTELSFEPEEVEGAGAYAIYPVEEDYSVQIDGLPSDVVHGPDPSDLEEEEAPSSPVRYLLRFQRTPAIDAQ